MALPPIEDPEDGITAEPSEFQALMREAQRYGFHYTGQDISELSALVSLAKTECGESHPVPCFGLNYESTDRRCRICQLHDACSAKDRRPRVEILDPNTLGDVICEACSSGSLNIELRVPDSTIVRDYGCSTPGCLNTLGIQTGWNEQRAISSPEICFEPKVKRRLPEVAKASEADKPKTSIKLKIPVTLRYKFSGKEYRSLNSIAAAITGSRSLNAKRFFECDISALSPGQILQQTWKGQLFTVEVIRAK
jgi:hypothetical protein